jgi:hypothetical protein
MDMKKDKDFIEYWNKKVKKERKEMNIIWGLVTIFWILAFIELYKLLKMI